MIDKLMNPKTARQTLIADAVCKIEILFRHQYAVGIKTNDSRPIYISQSKSGKWSVLYMNRDNRGIQYQGSLSRKEAFHFARKQV